MVGLCDFEPLIQYSKLLKPVGSMCVPGQDPADSRSPIRHRPGRLRTRDRCGGVVRALLQSGRMHTMPKTARWAATLTLTATAVCGPLTGSALAAPEPAASGLYAPSALVLTMGHGETAAAVTPERAAAATSAP